jgi:hypothetical protein
MSQSRTRFIGMDVHKETMAVAYIAQDSGAAVTSLGTMGTRPCDMDPRPDNAIASQAPHLCL